MFSESIESVMSWIEDRARVTVVMSSRARSRARISEWKRVENLIVNAHRLVLRNGITEHSMRAFQRARDQFQRTAGL